MYIIKSKNRVLSAFFPNDIPSVFSFNRRSFYSFSSKNEAEKFIKYIKKKVNDKNNQKRWGERFTKRYKNILKTLKVVKYNIKRD